MGQLQTIAKNSAVLLTAQVISYIFSFFITIYIARYLGTEGFGILSFALAFTGMFSVLADMGLNTFMVREVAREPAARDRYVTNIFLIKTLLAVLTLILIVVTINLLEYPPETILVVYILSLYIILNSLGGIFNSIFQAYQQMEWQSIGTILNSALLLGVVLMAIYLNLDVVAFASSYLLVSAVVLIYSFLIYIWKFHLPQFRVDLAFWHPTLGEAWHFGLISIFSTVYVWIDTLILSLFQGNEAVGIYNAAYRLVLVYLFIPTVFNMSIFPVMSRFFIDAQDSLKRTVEKYFDFMILIGTPLAVGTALLAPEIIMFIFGDQYTGAIIALQILVWSILFIFLNSPFFQLMSSIDRQQTLTRIVAICMVVNIVLNLIFIPRYSYVAASIITVITEFLAFILTLHSVRKLGYHILTAKMKLIGKVVLVSGLTGLVILYFPEFNLILTIIAAVLTYLVLIYLTKCVQREDIRLVKDILNRKT